MSTLFNKYEIKLIFNLKIFSRNHPEQNPYKMKLGVEFKEITSHSQIDKFFDVNQI